MSKLPEDNGKETGESNDSSILDWIRNKFSVPGLPNVSSHPEQKISRKPDDHDNLDPTLKVSQYSNQGADIEGLDRDLPISVRINIEMATKTRLAIFIKPEQTDAGDLKLSVSYMGDDLNQISVDVIDDSGSAVTKEVIEEKPTIWSRMAIGWDKSKSLIKEKHATKIVSNPLFLFFLVLLIYLVTRTIGLERFPIYFFTDEAIHTVLAEDLVQNDFHFNGNFLPIYFPFGSSYGLNSVTVYLQVIPYLLFGKSIFVTRLTAVLITFLGAIAIGLILKNFFKSPYWWSAVLILSITPTWFLHSRTAFENVSTASFYACFLYFYLRYRLRSPRAIYPAVICGGLVFYSHGLGQFLMAASGILLLISDLRYHIKNRRVVLGGFLLLILILYPYFHFYNQYPSIFQEQMAQRGSYWVNNSMSYLDKTTLFLRTYLNGFNPLYWFNPKPAIDLDRHVMKGYGHLLLPGIIFLILGLYLSIKKIRQPEHRIILIAFIASPFGAAFTEITILRTIWFVVPVTIFITLAITHILLELEKRNISRQILNYSLLFVLAGINIYMLGDVLINGPLWYRDYTLYGMQYGAKQLFDQAIPEILEERKSARIVVSPTWANGTDNYKEFFLTEEEKARVSFNTIDAYLYERLPVADELILVMTPNEYQQALNDRKLSQVELITTVDYPDGSPGFYFSKIRYVDDVEKIFEEEKEARKALVESIVTYSGEELIIQHSMLDMGNPVEIFDGNKQSLIRGLEANPFILDITFPSKFMISGIIADFAHMDFTITARLYSGQDSNPQVFEKTVRGVEGDPHFVMNFSDSPHLIDRLRIEILSLSHPERAHIHIRELDFIK